MVFDGEDFQAIGKGLVGDGVSPHVLGGQRGNQSSTKYG
jgi:hypothetical protein